MTYQFNQIGSDLELFLKDKQGNPVPVCGLLGGSKEFPKKILPDYSDGFAVQEDNVMVEFNVPPTSEFGMWMQNFKTMRTYLTGWADARDLTLCPQASMQFLPEQLQSPQAQTFGCDPDYSIWSMSQNQMNAQDPALRTLRTAGGHVHVSFFKDDHPPEPQDLTRVVKMLDLYLGVPSITFDKDQTRRAIYGKAGAFRPKSYGLEYRVLSGKWFESQDYVEWVFESVTRAFDHLRRYSEEQIDQMFEQHGEKLQATINEGKEENVDFFTSIGGLYFPKPRRNKKEKRELSYEDMLERVRLDLNPPRRNRPRTQVYSGDQLSQPTGTVPNIVRGYTPQNWADDLPELEVAEEQPQQEAGSNG